MAAKYSANDGDMSTGFPTMLRLNEQPRRKGSASSSRKQSCKLGIKGVTGYKKYGIKCAGK